MSEREQGPSRRRFQFSLRTFLAGALAITVVIALGRTWYLASQHGKISLHLAADRGDFDEVRWLVEHGADVNAVQFDDTPLTFAAGRGHTEICKYLVAHGTDINKGRDAGRSALVQAICNLHPDLARWLIYQGADVRVCDKEGDTVLHYAVEYSTLEVVELLIARGADVNARTRYGRTPLYAVVAYRANRGLAIAQVLLEHGADASILTDEGLPEGMGRRPLDRAMFYDRYPKSRYRKTVELLRRYDGDD